MRSQALPCAFVAIVIGLATGCGGDATTSSTSPDPDVEAAKKDLLVAYRFASKARLHGLRCSLSRSLACHHPLWYPPDGALVADVGSELLDRLKVGLAPSTDQVARRSVTYILSDKTRRKSLVLAQKTSNGTILVLHGSPSGSTFRQVAASDSIANDSSTATAARPTVSVPDVRGMPLSAAQRTLVNAKLGLSYGYKPGESPPGSRIVRRQHPSPGSRLYEWKYVELYFRRK